ncbi:MAG: sulfite exporter TauE/SafE family protein [Dethiobacteria bacterium]|jgi:uncharacterized membrane protein YfcA
MGFVNALLGTLVALTSVSSYFFVKDYIKNREPDISNKQNAANVVIGFIANFFDTLGIGSYATTMSTWKLFGLCRDKKIPGTLNLGCTIPVAIEALVFITVIKVDPVTLVSMLIAGIVGAYLGAGVVSKLPERKVQIGVGIALLIAAFFMLAGKFGWMPGGGEAIGLTGSKLIIAVVANFILGALLTLGIGCYAPLMALVYALGMSPKVAFPIMMGTGAFLLPVASFKFIKEGAYERKTAMWYTLGGIPAVLIAAYIVKSLPLDTLMWVVICVVAYTSIYMLRTAFKPSSEPELAVAQDTKA